MGKASGEWGSYWEQRRIHYWVVPGVRTLCGQVRKVTSDFRRLSATEIRRAYEQDPLGSGLPRSLCKVCYGLTDLEGEHQLIESDSRDWSCSCGVKFKSGDYIPEVYEEHRQEVERKRRARGGA